RLRPALPAHADGPGLRLPGRERRGAVAHADLAAALAAPLHRAAQGASGLRARHLRAARRPLRQPAHLRPRAPLRGGHRALRSQRRALGAGSPARSERVRGDDSRGDARPLTLPADRQAPLPAHPRAAGLLLVPAREAGVTALLPEQDLIAFVAGQRWFGQKTQEVTGAQVLDAAVLPTRDPELVIALVEIRFYTGTHQNYQLLYAHRDGDTNLDALADVSHARELVHLIRSGATAEAGEGKVEFNAQPGFAALGRELEHARLMGAEQSNTSVVFGEELVLKVYRRLEPGLNPELELLRFLTERGFPNVAPLGGWYAYMGRPLEA